MFQNKDSAGQNGLAFYHKWVVERMVSWDKACFCFCTPSWQKGAVPGVREQPHSRARSSAGGVKLPLLWLYGTWLRPIISFRAPGGNRQPLKLSNGRGFNEGPFARCGQAEGIQQELVRFPEQATGGSCAHLSGPRGKGRGGYELQKELEGAGCRGARPLRKEHSHCH